MKKNRIHGTPEQFEAALKNRIRELGGDAEITSASEIDSDSKERYIHTLIGDIDSELGDKVDSITFDTDKNNLIITVSHSDAVREYTVPFKDLKFDWDNIESDVSYVVDEILDDLDVQNVNESTEINASEFDELDSQMSDLEDKLEAKVLEKLESVGVDVNSKEALWYADGAVDLILQDDNHDVEYWWKETKANYMDEVDALPHV